MAILRAESNMANHKSAIKRMRQTAHRTERHRAHRSRLRTQLKKFSTAASQKDKAKVGELLGPTIGMVDKAVQKGVLHRNKGNRLKSSLSLAANKATAAS